jgi:dTDP-4-dehydrorhamnose 3,5-epimerase-like enzyme
MTFAPGQLDGLWVIGLEPRKDPRGWFARTWCEEEFSRHGLNVRWPQANTTRTLRRGMIRGMHWQAEPHPEIKLIRCSRGAVWDVVVDVRPHSATFGRWEAFELSESNQRVPVPDRRRRTQLPDVGRLSPRPRTRVPLERPRRRHTLADRQPIAIRP